MKTLRAITVVFGEKEERDFMLAFRKAGLEWNSDGIKKALDFFCFGDVKPPPIEKNYGADAGAAIIKALKENPEVVNNVAALAQQFFVKAALRFKKPPT